MKRHVIEGWGGVEYLDPTTQTTHDSPIPPHLSWTLVQLGHSLFEWPQTIHLMSLLPQFPLLLNLEVGPPSLLQS